MAQVPSGSDDSLIAMKQAHDALVHAGFYIACSSPGMSEDGLLMLRQAVFDLRAALDSARKEEARQRAMRN